MDLDYGLSRDVHVPNGIHGHGPDYRDRRCCRALEIRRVRRFVNLYGCVDVSTLRQLGLGRWLAGNAGLKFWLGSRILRFRRLWRGALRWRHDRTRALTDHWATYWQIQPKWQTQSDAGTRHRHRAHGMLHSRLRVVRLQSRKYACRIR